MFPNFRGEQGQMPQIPPGSAPGFQPVVTYLVKNIKYLKTCCITAVCFITSLCFIIFSFYSISIGAFLLLPTFTNMGAKLTTLSALHNLVVLGLEAQTCPIQLFCGHAMFYQVIGKCNCCFLIHICQGRIFTAAVTPKPSKLCYHWRWQYCFHCGRGLQTFIVKNPIKTLARKIDYWMTLIFERYIRTQVCNHGLIIFGEQNDYNLTLYLTTKHVFENFWRGQLPSSGLNCSVEELSHFMKLIWKTNTQNHNTQNAFRNNRKPSKINLSCFVREQVHLVSVH